MIECYILDYYQFYSDIIYYVMAVKVIFIYSKQKKQEKNSEIDYYS